MRKKALVIGLVILFILLLSIYFFIPSVVRVSAARTIAIPPSSVIRGFNNANKLENWWPGSISGEKITYNKYDFRFTQFDITNIQKVTIYSSDGNSDSLNSLINSLPLQNDSSILLWTCHLKSSFSPVSRITQYLKSREVKKTMADILDSFSRYSMDVKNIYGVSIQREKVPDSVLILEKKEFSFQPGVAEIYAGIHSLKQHIALQNGKQTNYPICNISAKDSGGFSLVVAIPIKEPIKETTTQKIKRLLYNGNILTTELTGGAYTINKALKALDNFMTDYHLMPAAISYQTLITDREKLTDTSKWVTKICYPIY